VTGHAVVILRRWEDLTVTVVWLGYSLDHALAAWRRMQAVGLPEFWWHWIAREDQPAHR
jgi:hypothetical protein